MGRSWVVGALGALVACGQSTTAVLTIEDAPTVIVVDEAQRVQAFDLTVSGASLRLELDGGSHELTALRYTQSLVSMMLSQGPLTPSDKGGLVPAPFRADRLRVDQKRSPGWTELTPIPGALAQLRVQERSPCLQFDSSVESVEGSMGRLITIMTRIDDETALLGTSDGRFFHVRRNGLELIPAAGAPVRHLRAARDGQGQLWLAGSGSQVYRGTPEAGFLAVSSRQLGGDPVLAIAASPEPGVTDVLVMTSSIGLERFDGLAWRVVRRPDLPIDMHGEYAALWSQPGHFITTSPRPSELLEIDASDHLQVTDLMLPAARSSDAVTALALSPDFGPVVGTNNGLVFTLDAGHWGSLDVPAEEIDAIYAILPVPGRGMILGGRRSTFVQWYQTYGDCGFVGTSIGRNAHHIVALGKDVVAAARGSEPTDPVLVAYLVLR
ncbi:MAG: hypothetical protein U1E65_35515 [Myxococcota bacterium]